ncbi:basic leucine zipper 9 isoform X2 [Ziziphus jujuba]|uniref:Basic leucine zipper 9 isoform X2 n=2 Tax=Ziziphus jujuba TaxID=326968 RepID=A0A6P3Z1Y4_ZIZJJ|nr:basic leucine zipper 9 isoform X2 [Ziziphus jujuba]KAH7524237.1 hypothetical protein FEM48_Zijuj06G0097900 [Ziziphus jujuba var. spinosa]
MEHKVAGRVVPSTVTQSQTTSLYSSCGDMKRSPSELALQEFLILTNENEEEKIGDLRNQRDRFFSETEGFFGDVYSVDFSCGFKNRDFMNGFSSGELIETLMCSPNPTTKNSSISVTMDSQSSICVGSPISANKPKDRDDNQAAGATSTGSSREPSDDEDVEIEAGPCEQSTKPVDVKRYKRMVSNRESARRSRKRRQAHLAELESQVEQLREENSTLFKHFTDAAHQYRDADTNNRVLKSNVEAMRAKVKLAEDMVARGSLTCNLNQLIQTHLTTPQQLGTPSLRRAAHVSPTINVPGDHDGSFSGITGQSNSALGLGNSNINNNSVNSTIMNNDNISCVSDISLCFN